MVRVCDRVATGASARRLPDVIITVSLGARSVGAPCGSSVWELRWGRGRGCTNSPPQCSHCIAIFCQQHKRTLGKIKRQLHSSPSRPTRRQRQGVEQADAEGLLAGGRWENQHDYTRSGGHGGRVGAWVWVERSNSIARTSVGYWHWHCCWLSQNKTCCQPRTRKVSRWTQASI